MVLSLMPVQDVSCIGLLTIGDLTGMNRPYVISKTLLNFRLLMQDFTIFWIIYYRDRSIL